MNNKNYNPQKQNKQYKDVQAVGYNKDGAKQQQTNNPVRKAEQSYSYYSRLLEKPFDTVDELMAAEEAVRAEQRAKEDKAAQKKADAIVVEDAFKALNAARRTYKESIDAVTNKYRTDLEEMRKAFEARVDEIKVNLATAETDYQTALKNFAEKYPEGYHITLKDGDFETTIHMDTKNTHTAKTPDPFDLFFRLLF